MRSYRISRYLLTDKHGYTHRVFNAKVNIHRQNGASTYLGVQESELDDFGVVEQIAEDPSS
jgi:hypothetical protein